MVLPWWALSPSPFTAIIYLALVIYGTRKLLKLREYKRLKYVVAFSDSAFILAFLVLLLDTFWIIFCGLRFGWFFPDSVVGLVLAGARNLVFMAVCWLLVGRYFEGLLKPRALTFILFCANLTFLGLWFWLSPTPAYTDWTFAIKYDYPLSTVATSFLTSHVIGKSLVAVMFLSYW